MTDQLHRRYARIRIRDLVALTVTAQTKNMLAASVILGMSQPAMSASVASLEQVVGMRLLARQPRGVTLTAAGLLMLGHTLKLKVAMQVMATEMEALRLSSSA